MSDPTTGLPSDSSHGGSATPSSAGDSATGSSGVSTFARTAAGGASKDGTAARTGASVHASGFIRGCYALGSKFPLLDIRRQRFWALLLLIAQTGITFTGSVVRVTGSGLGCPTWPQCQPGSLVPEPGARPAIHQAIEFGNRTLTFVLVALAVVVFLAVARAKRRPGLIWLALLQGFGIIAQAVIGGISVRLDLAWWMVSLHFLPSMLLVWFAAMLWVRVADPDDGTPRREYVPALRWLGVFSAAALAVTLITGTMTTGAGPHAGDSEVPADSRLNISLDLIAHIHAHFMYLYLGLTVGLLCALVAMRAPKNVLKTAGWVTLFIILQAGVGIIQYWLGVPRWTVPLHVVGSGIVCALTGVLWSQGYRYRGGASKLTGSMVGDEEKSRA